MNDADKIELMNRFVEITDKSHLLLHKHSVALAKLHADVAVMDAYLQSIAKKLGIPEFDKEWLTEFRMKTAQQYLDEDIL